MKLLRALLRIFRVVTKESHQHNDAQAAPSTATKRAPFDGRSTKTRTLLYSGNKVTEAETSEFLELSYPEKHEIREGVLPVRYGLNISNPKARKSQCGISMHTVLCTARLIDACVLSGKVSINKGLALYMAGLDYFGPLRLISALGDKYESGHPLLDFARREEMETFRDILSELSVDIFKAFSAEAIRMIKLLNNGNRSIFNNDNDWDSARRKLDKSLSFLKDDPLRSNSVNFKITFEVKWGKSGNENLKYD